MIACPVDEQVPIPTQGEKPFADVYDRARAACMSANELLDHGYSAPEQHPADVAKKVAPRMKQLVETGDTDMSDITVSPIGAILVHQILSQYCEPIVKDAQKMRNFITNKLVIETDSNDSRTRLKALELLGKIKGIDLFTERSEITVHNKSDSELLDVLKSKLRKLADVSDAVILSEPTKLNAPIDVDEAL